jgi:hypothetical protein
VSIACSNCGQLTFAPCPRARGQGAEDNINAALINFRIQFVAIYRARWRIRAAGESVCPSASPGIKK